MSDAGHPEDDITARSALEARLLGRRSGARPRGGLDPVPRQGALALSPAQHRIWFFDRLVHDPSTNNIVQAERLRGPVSLAALAQAVDAVVARHEPLRFRFEVTEGVPRTRPAETVPALTVTRVAGTRPEDRDEIARTLADEVASRPFDLTADPPFRAEAFVFAPDDVVFVHVVHHIAADEWSVRVLQEEIAAAYAAALAGAAPELPPLRVQYADFAAWQNAGLAEGRWAGAEAHFTDLLAGAPTTVALPFAGPAPATAGHGPAIRTVAALDPAVAGRLDALGRAQGATPFMTMLAASLAFLHVAGRQEDLAVSSLTAGRARPELDGLVGMFTNNVVLRTALSPDRSFAGFLAPVRDQVLKAIAYQDYPFDVLMRRLRPASGTIPFGSVMFTHRHAFPPAIGGEVTSVPVSVTESDAKFDLWFSIIDEGPRRVVRLVADSARYGASDLAELTETYVRFLGAVATAPEAPLAALLGPVRHAIRPSEAAPAPPAVLQRETETERRLVAVWRDVLRAEPPDPDTSFFDAGGDSLLLMQFVHRIAEAFGTDLPMIEVFVAPTIRGVARLIDDHGPQTPAAPAQEGLLVPLTRLVSSDRPPFYVVSGAGGHVLPFASVARRLEDRWRGVGLLDPAFDDTEETPGSIGEVAERLIDGLRRADPAGPHLFAGYSYGGFVAFEMARRIAAAGGRAGVVILDTRLPPGGVTRALRLRLDGLRARLRSIVRPAEPELPPENPLYDDRALRENARRRVMGDHQRALVTGHRPAKAGVPIVVLRALGSVRDVDAPDYRWSDVGRVLTVTDTAGDHLSLFKGRNEPAFVAALDHALTRLRADLEGG
jgi:thioesterase domain-containing protein/acyl carrier protein